MAFTTKKTLLAKVRAGDAVSWTEFYQTYKPLITLCGRDCGLTADENEELVQQVMAEIFHKDIIGKYDPDHVPDGIVFQYDPARGRFRHYLKGIVRNHAHKIYHRRKNDLSLNDETVVIPEASDDAWSRLWNDEWQQHVLNMALAELKNHVHSETFVAFEMYALQDRPVQEVADFLNLSVAAVYTAKSRCLAALRQIVGTLEER